MGLRLSSPRKPRASALTKVHETAGDKNLKRGVSRPTPFSSEAEALRDRSFGASRFGGGHGSICVRSQGNSGWRRHRRRRGHHGRSLVSQSAAQAHNALRRSVMKSQTPSEAEASGSRRRAARTAVERRWRLSIAAVASALAAFVLGLGVVTLVEVSAGRSLSSIFGGPKSGTTVGGVINGVSPSSTTTTPTTTSTTSTTTNPATTSTTSTTTTTTTVPGATSSTLLPTSSTTAPTRTVP